MIFRLILFSIVLLSSLFLLHFFLYYPLIKAYSPSKKVRRIILVLFISLFIIIIAGETASRTGGFYWLALIGRIWLGVLSISTAVMAVNLIILFAFRRIFRYSTTVSLFLILIISVAAIRMNHSPPVVVEYDIHSDKISQESDGFRLILVSEFHLTGAVSTKWLDRTIDLINRLEPDAVVVTGDLIDEPYDRIAHFVPSFRTLLSRYGVFSVPGNHDYYQGIDSYFRFTDRAGMVNLLNTNIRITEDIVIAGVTDRTAKEYNLEPPDTEKTLQGIDPEKYVIFLSHQPLYHEEALDLGADLVLAGHTHRGQIPPMVFLIELYYRFPYGLYKEEGGIIYTTSGVNVWGPPMRFLSQNEIVVFNLYSDQ